MSCHLYITFPNLHWSFSGILFYSTGQLVYVPPTWFLWKSHFFFHWVDPDIPSVVQQFYTSYCSWISAVLRAELRGLMLLQSFELPSCSKLYSFHYLIFIRAYFSLQLFPTFFPSSCMLTFQMNFLISNSMKKLAGTFIRELKINLTHQTFTLGENCHCQDIESFLSKNRRRLYFLFTSTLLSSR